MTSDATPERATQLELARRIALDQLAVRQRSVSELRRTLARRNVPQDVADEVIERFTDVGLLDDAAFAATVTQSRSEHSGRGRARIRQELRAKGVDREVVEEALAKVDSEDEYRSALEVARRRLRSLAGLEPHVARRRLAGVLARRGFPGSVISSVVAEALNEDPVEFSTGEQ